MCGSYGTAVIRMTMDAGVDGAMAGYASQSRKCEDTSAE